MAKSVTNPVQTQPVGFAPILRHYFEKCSVAKIIDEHVTLDPRRKVLTHGQASVAMITGILFQVLQLYRLCKFASETNTLDVILPEIAPSEYFDDRLADTLDALHDFGLGNLEMLITKHMIAEFGIKSISCHNDTTTASVFGDCNTNQTPDSIEITFGYSKKKRKDLKQLVWSLSVSSDSGFPLFQKAYSGNTADVETYVEQWHNLIDLLDDVDFLFVADSKLVSKENLCHIDDNEGFFLASVPMYESYKEVFFDALNNNTSEILIPYKGKMNRGFETPITIEYNDKTYVFRMAIIYDQGLFARKSKTLDNRVEKTRQAFDELKTKLNKYRLKTFESIETACNNILKKHKTGNYFKFDIINTPVTIVKNKHRGKPPKNRKPETITTQEDHFSIDYEFNAEAFENAKYTCGYYPLITNKLKKDFPIADIMMAYKGQYKSEHLNRRAKSNLNLEPIYLHTPKRIETLLFLFKIALQIIVLMERHARKEIKHRDKGLDNFMPNRKDVRNPTSEYMLAEFQYIVKGEMTLPDGNTYGFVSELNELQKDILDILGVPIECFTYDHLFGMG